jgi:hypothetical protein
MMYQLEQMSIVEIYNYFEGTIHIDYITEIITNNDDKYFDTILLNYLVC